MLHNNTVVLCSEALLCSTHASFGVGGQSSELNRDKIV